MFYLKALYVKSLKLHTSVSHQPKSLPSSGDLPRDKFYSTKKVILGKILIFNYFELQSSPMSAAETFMTMKARSSPSRRPGQLHKRPPKKIRS